MGYKALNDSAVMEANCLSVDDVALIECDEDISVNVSGKAASSEKEKKSKGKQALKCRRAVEELLEHRRMLKELDYFEEDLLLNSD